MVECRKRRYIACTMAAVVAGMSYGYFMRLRNKNQGPPEYQSNDGKTVFYRDEVQKWKALASWRTCKQGQNIKRVAMSDKVRFDLYVSKAWLTAVRKRYGGNLSPRFRAALQEKFPT